MAKKSKKQPEPEPKPEPEPEEMEEEEGLEEMMDEDEDEDQLEDHNEVEEDADMQESVEDYNADDSLDEEEAGSDEEDENDEHAYDPSKMQDPKVVRARIDDALEQLENLREAKKSRSDIMEELARDLSEYYSYLPELTELFLSLFSPAECVEFMDANDRPRPLVIRTNTLKTTRKDLMEILTKRGAGVEAIDWSKVAIKVTESSVPIGATPEYLAGHYMLQSASSMNPVMALDPQPNERVLDMSSAPGGKTSYIAQLMKNSGIVIANDLKPNRQKATVANLHRLGVKNSIVTCYDGRRLGQVIKGFDRILLDAPCSGLGIIARDQSVKLQRTMKDILRNAHLQKELLRTAVDLVDVKTAGIVVYSTCSVSVEENEMVVQYILDRKYVKLVETGLTVGRKGLTRYQGQRFHPSLALTRRFYPHSHNMDGFFVAKFRVYKRGDKEIVEEGEGKEKRKKSGEGKEGEEDEEEWEGEEEDEEGETEEEEAEREEVKTKKVGEKSKIEKKKEEKKNEKKEEEKRKGKKEEKKDKVEVETAVKKRGEEKLAKVEKIEKEEKKKDNKATGKKGDKKEEDKKFEQKVPAKAPSVPGPSPSIPSKESESKEEKKEGKEKKRKAEVEKVEEKEAAEGPREEEEEEISFPVMTLNRGGGRIQALRAAMQAKKKLKL